MKQQQGLRGWRRRQRMCWRCHHKVTHGLWRVYLNGTRHLLPWCVGCEQQTSTSPLPSTRAVVPFERHGQVTAITVVWETWRKKAKKVKSRQPTTLDALVQLRRLVASQRADQERDRWRMQPRRKK